MPGENVRVHAPTMFRPLTSSSPAKLASLPPMFRIERIGNHHRAPVRRITEEQSVLLGKLVIDSPIATVQVAAFDWIRDVIVRKAGPLRQGPEIHQTRAYRIEPVRGNYIVREPVADGSASRGVCACRQRIENPIWHDASEITGTNLRDRDCNKLRVAEYFAIPFVVQRKKMCGLAAPDLRSSRRTDST